jgi:hypothetical protein
VIAPAASVVSTGFAMPRFAAAPALLGRFDAKLASALLLRASAAAAEMIERDVIARSTQPNADPMPSPARPENPVTPVFGLVPWARTRFQRSRSRNEKRRPGNNASRPQEARHD